MAFVYSVVLRFGLVRGRLSFERREPFASHFDRRLGFVPDVWLPSYTVVDLGIGYKWKRLTMDLLVRNVFDEYAFRSTGGAALVFPEKPRNATLRFKYAF